MFDYQDRFIVKKEDSQLSLSSVDIFSLTRLYLPLIGVDSYSLYMLLSTLEKECEIKLLLDSMSLTSIKALNQSLEKLEAVGLIKRYQKKHDDFYDYIFYLRKPLSKDEFKNCRVLYEYLCGQIGKVSVNELLKTEKVSNKYKDVSKSFDEVFETSTLDVTGIYPEFSKQKIDSLIKFNEDRFDYIIFKTSLNNILTEDLLEDSYFKKMIKEVSFTYKLNEEEMKQVVLNTINFDKDLTIDLLSNRAFIEYKKKYNSKDVKLQTVNNDMFVKSSLDENVLKLFELCESQSIVEVLNSLSGIIPSQVEISMFERIKNETGFGNGLINYMAFYFSNVNKGVIPSYNYFMKICNDWSRRGIRDIRSAHDAIMARSEAKQSKSTKRQTPTTSWYDDYTNELKENVKEEKEIDIKETFEKATNLFKKGN